MGGIVFKNQNIISLLFCCCFCFKLIAQESKDDANSFSPQEIWQSGIPLIENFTTEDYNSNPNNWAFVEGADGLMYVGNGFGVLEYDGVNWRTITLSNNSIVRSLAKSESEKIYVGGVSEFGFLERNNLGETTYFSISSTLRGAQANFGLVNSIVCLKESVFFCTEKFLFRWDGKNVKFWESSQPFNDVFAVDDSLLISIAGEGLMTIDEDRLKLVNGGSHFKEFDKRVSIIEPYKGKYLIGIPFEGLFSFDFEAPKKVGPKIKYEFKDKEIYGSCLLSNGDIVIATLTAGIYIISGADGRILRNYRVKDGLLSNAINAVYQARDGALWLAYDRGITRMDLASPLRKFDAQSGLTERVRNVVYDGNTLYAGSQGIYKLENSNPARSFVEPVFKKIKGVDQTVRYVIPANGTKLLIERKSIISLDDNDDVQIIPGSEGESYSYAVKSKAFANTVYVSAQSGNLYQYNLVDNSWNFRVIAKLDEEIVKITEEANGDLWLSTYYNGIHKLNGRLHDPKEGNYYPTKHYDSITGLPSNVYNFAEYLNGKILVVNQNHGIYSFNNETDRFSRDVSLMMQYDSLGASLYSGQIHSDLYGNGWQAILSKEFNKVYRIAGSKVGELKESNLITDFMTFNIASADSVLMFSGPKGVVAYNQAVKRPYVNNYKVQLRGVYSKNDSLIYSGSGGEMDKEFNYDSNAIVFEYSLPFYTSSDKNEYQYQLDGFDTDWSSWSFDTKKYYTNIPEGEYTFKVRAKNIFGEISEEDSYSFTILPPWYRTWWAYGLYGLGAILTLILFSRWRSNQLRAKNVALEKVIDKRTIEIKEKNLQLENQTERLKELDTMKTRLFANISHEFRTPLTLIKGPVEKMEENGEETLSMTNVKMIRRNANRLLKLVNQLLDLSKLDSGKLQLNAAEGDMFKCLRAAASSFSSHAAQRDIDYQISIPSRSLWANFDRDKIEKIAYNLLSNAFKFTQDKGKIVLAVSYRGERLQLRVSDSGQGIAKDKLPHIFDRFFQVDDSYTREKAGSGIGLALTKELVDLMRGEIYVESEFGKGSVFKVVIDLEEIKSHKKQESEEYKMVPQDVREKNALLAQTEKKERQILIIEDNNDMRHFIREQLQGEYEVLEAFNGKEGLKKAKKMVPDLIITDLMMPQMDGITLCKELKVGIHTSHIPVVMLTAKAGIENKLEGLETGADDYLTKPFNSRELQARVKNLINERQKLRELFAQKPEINPKEITVTSLDEKFLNQVLELLEEKHIESEFGVPQMQDALGMSKTQLHRKLKALTDHPPGELLRNFRLKRAAQLLLQKGENVSQIAYAVGFNGLSYFTKCFRELYGVAPTEYARKDDSDG